MLQVAMSKLDILQRTRYHAAQYQQCGWYPFKFEAEIEQRYWLTMKHYVIAG